MSGSTPGETSGGGKKHIKFTKSVDEAEKERRSPRAWRSSKVPKHERESERFRAETLEQVRIFRAARKGWMESMINTEVGAQAVDKGMQRLEIDRRRINLMKKLGVKVSMVRPHRKTLRPRIYFTFKKSLLQRDLAMAQARLEAQRAAINEKTKVKLMKDFRKLAKNAADQMIEECNVPDRKQKIASDVELKSLSEGQSGTKEPDKGLGDVPLPEDERGVVAEEILPVKSEGDLQLTEQEEDGLTSESREEFNKIIKKLKTSPKYASITDEDVDAMKKAWREFRRLQAGEMKVTSEVKEKKSLKPRDSFKWFKKETWTRPKTEFRPCSCPIVEGDGVIILKSVCDCSGKVQGAKTVILESENAGGTGTQIPQATDESDIPVKPSFSMDKVVDSLEMIRNKFPSKSLPSLQDRGKSNSTEEAAGETVVPEEVPSQNVAEEVPAMEEFLSGESIPENVKPVKPIKPKFASSKLSKSSDSVSSGHVRAKKKKLKSILGKKHSRKSKAGCTRVNFQDVTQQVGEEPKEESSSKMTKTVMSVDAGQDRSMGARRLLQLPRHNT